MTFTRGPQRVLTNDQNMLEMLLALGLEDRIVAATGVRESVPDQLADRFDRVDEVSEDYLGDLESVLAHDVDLVYAGWNYGLTGLSGFDLPRYQALSALIVMRWCGLRAARSKSR